jgi:hypothetical protein
MYQVPANNLVHVLPLHKATKKGMYQMYQMYQVPIHIYSLIAHRKGKNSLPP